MAIVRLLLLLAAAIAQHYAFTPPNARPPSEELRELRGAEQSIPYVVTISRTLIWSWAFLEGSVLFALSGHCPPILARQLLHAFFPTSLTTDASTARLTSLTTLTPALLGGACLSLAAVLLRGYCFHKLGPRFTFELSIRPSHALVTEGAYGVVRHPSYTAVLGITVGWLLCATDRQGSVVAVCVGFVQALSGDGGQGGNRDRSEDAVMTSLLLCVWATVLGMVYLVIHKRMNKEDAMLEKNFGEEWRAWARRVPYRLIPGVY